MKATLIPYAVIVGGSVLVGECAAIAVDFGFGAAFVGDGVAAAITAYVAGLIAFFVGKRTDSEHWTQRGLIRAPIGALLGVGLLALFRTALLVELPWMEAGTTGHSPYFILPVVGLVPTLLFEFLFQLSHRSLRDRRG